VPKGLFFEIFRNDLEMSLSEFLQLLNESREDNIFDVN